MKTRYLLMAGMATALSGLALTTTHLPLTVSDSGEAKVQKPAISKPVKTLAEERLAHASMTKAAPMRLGSSETASLYESFDNREPGDQSIPAGWSTMTIGDANPDTEWYVTDEEDFVPPVSGRYYMAANPGEKGEFDQWLISPSFDVKEGQRLTLHTFLYAYSMYVIDQSHVDFLHQPIEFKKKEQQATLEILIREEGNEEWTLVKNCIDDFADWSFSKCNSWPSSMSLQTIDIQRYAGKRVELAFRHVGKGSQTGCTIALDEVLVDLPRLDVTYNDPQPMLYYGTECNANLTHLDSKIGFQPVYAPITWTHSNDFENTTYKWQYTLPGGTSRGVSAEKDLTVTYLPDYTDNFTTTNNFIDPVVLQAYCDGTSGGSYAGTVDFFQAGGAPKVQTNAGLDSFGLLPFDMSAMDISVTWVGEWIPDNDEDWIPIFGGYTTHQGYDRVSDWMTAKYFGEEQTAGDCVKVKAFANEMAAPASPLVLNGLWANTIGEIDDDAEFILTIYGADNDGKRQATIDTASVKGNKTIQYQPLNARNYITLPFEFDAPVVLDKTYPMYHIEISGYDNPEHVFYFAPIQTKRHLPNKECLSHIRVEVTRNGETTTELIPLYLFNEGESGFCYSAFYINLDGCYPWLHSEASSLLVARGAESVLPLDSYYDGADLNATVTGLPEGHAPVSVQVKGQYGNAQLSVTSPACDCAEPHHYTIDVTAPGVALKVNAYEENSSVKTLTDAEMARVVSVHTLNGFAITPAEMVPGNIYIVTFSDGTSRKATRIK